MPLRLRHRRTVYGYIGLLEIESVLSVWVKVLTTFGWQLDPGLILLLAYMMGFLVAMSEVFFFPDHVSVLPHHFVLCNTMFRCRVVSLNCVTSVGQTNITRMRSLPFIWTTQTRILTLFCLHDNFFNTIIDDTVPSPMHARVRI